MDSSSTSSSVPIQFPKTKNQNQSNNTAADKRLKERNEKEASSDGDRLLMAQNKDSAAGSTVALPTANTTNQTPIRISLDQSDPPPFTAGRMGVVVVGDLNVDDLGSPVPSPLSASPSSTPNSVPGVPGSCSPALGCNNNGSSSSGAGGGGEQLKPVKTTRFTYPLSTSGDELLSSLSSPHHSPVKRTVIWSMAPSQTDVGGDGSQTLILTRDSHEKLGTRSSMPPTFPESPSYYHSDFESGEHSAGGHQSSMRKFSLRKKRSSGQSMESMLSAKERRIIKRSWTKVTNLTEYGQRVYIHIFSLNPTVMSFFPFANIAAAGDGTIATTGCAISHRMYQDERFIKQANLFVTFIQKCVELVDENDYSRLSECCRKLGGLHAQLAVPFHSEWWSLYRDAFLSCIQPYCRSAPVLMSAWRRLFDKINSEMQVGYMEAKGRGEFGSRNKASDEKKDEIGNREQQSFHHVTSPRDLHGGSHHGSGSGSNKEKKHGSSLRSQSSSSTSSSGHSSQQHRHLVGRSHSHQEEATTASEGHHSGHQQHRKPFQYKAHLQKYRNYTDGGAPIMMDGSSATAAGMRDHLCGSVRNAYSIEEETTSSSKSELAGSEVNEEEIDEGIGGISLKIPTTTTGAGGTSVGNNKGASPGGDVSRQKGQKSSTSGKQKLLLRQEKDDQSEGKLVPPLSSLSMGEVGNNKQMMNPLPERSIRGTAGDTNDVDSSSGVVIVDGVVGHNKSTKSSSNSTTTDSDSKLTTDSGNDEGH